MKSIRLDPITSLWFRPGSGDEIILAEYNKGSWSELDPCPGDVILDIGSHIGASSKSFISKGADVIALEADFSTQEIFKLNAPEARLRLGLASRYEGERKKFYLNPQNTWSQSIYRSNSLVEVEVKTIDISREFHRVNKIKCDIEGSEYSLPWDLITPNISKIGIEFHESANNLEKIALVTSVLSKLGFTEFNSTHTQPTRKIDTIAFFTR